jgi:hypothetical protein
VFRIGRMVFCEKGRIIDGHGFDFLGNRKMLH